MTDRSKQSRAELARQVIDNPMYQEAFVMVRASCVDALQKIKPTNEKEMADQVRTLQNLDRLERVLKKAMEDGKIEKKRSSILPLVS